MNLKTKTMYFILSLIILLSACSKAEDTEMIDNIKPVLNCNADITQNISATENVAIVNFDIPIGTDNISNVTVTQIEGLSSGDEFPVGTTVNTFKASDASGNTTTCSFNVTVIRDEPAEDKPYFIGSDPTPDGKTWVFVDTLTDEFEGDSENIDTNKWNPDPYNEPRFSWIGRFPGLFETDNIRIKNGELWMEGEKFESPKTVQGENWTHGGAIIRSEALLMPGTFCETKMKTTETIMSGTFWMSTPNADCNTVIKKELDVTESIGTRSYVTKLPVEGWFENTAVNFRSGINATARQRSSSCLPAINKGKTASEAEPQADFHTYGFFWESPTELHFYFDGVKVFSIDPPTPFNDGMAITLAIETYDFNLPSNAEDDGFNKTLEERSTRYKYIRTWSLEDK
ncbi:hypothetical protein BW723_04070 [Polaribacter reichenbachii]|uniref:HYR domain-containing protein n=1 Tax=Polaribacter reichenbachii TaxID=996801 RepID=A0A1B8TUX1_9FLAO|nr:HYR domain-containing protein [Polaribacter reichenbachii]APZ45521.1 hypothetical protein BW723_04070 [Polaribacter reichenbachii]AUC19383.1 hypothetical protein BTO17_12075 [Polaribacter reichenbachii]OBY63463.1 hypothetical protein LPB301_11640 [Polaribacter reichenbachii]